MKPRLGRYKLIRKLAQGGMAQVYLARQSGADGFSKKVVIKRVHVGGPDDPAFNEMFLSEAVLAAQLAHPNVVHVYDFAQANDERFIVMEYVDGPSLKALCKLAAKAGRVMPVAHCLKIASWVCEGLAYAHELRHERTGEPLKVVHRDITPDNILITRTGVVKIIDFGIAKAATQVHRTQPGEMKGKLAYVAPEQLRGEDVDARADLFSLGVVLYEALTGLQPFSRDNPAATMEAVVRLELLPISQLRPEAPPGLDQVLAKATAKNREDRYQNALEMQAALELEVAQLAPNFAPARLRDLVQSLDPAPPYEEEDTTTADTLALSTPADSDEVHTEVFVTGPQPAVSAGKATTKTSPRLQAPALPFEFNEDADEAPKPALSSAPRPAAGETSRSGRRSNPAMPQVDAAPPPPALVPAPVPSDLGPEPGTPTIDIVDAPPLRKASGSPPVERARLPVVPLLGLMVLTGVATWFISAWVSRTEPPPQPIVVTLKPAPPPPAPAPIEVEPVAVDAADAAVAVEVPDAGAKVAEVAEAPAPVAAAVADAGSGVKVSLKSTPPATVWIDGAKAGDVPLEVQLEAGSHRLRFDGPDAGLNKSVTIRVNKGQPLEKEYVFERAHLTLEAPEGATIFLGKRKLGIAPIEPMDLYEGTYRFRAVAQDQNLDVTKVIELKPGESTARIGAD